MVPVLWPELHGRVAAATLATLEKQKVFVLRYEADPMKTLSGVVQQRQPALELGSSALGGSHSGTTLASPHWPRAISLVMGSP